MSLELGDGGALREVKVGVHCGFRVATAFHFPSHPWATGCGQVGGRALDCQRNLRHEED